METKIRSTTIVGLARDGKVALASDGQVTLGNTVVKHTAKKVQRLYNNTVLVGFAGAAADAFTLMERFEEKLQKHQGNLERSAVELAKDWRMDKYLRRLEAMIGVLDKDHAFIISGTGDVITPDDGIVAIGSGEKSLLTQPGKYADFMLVGIGMLFLGISVVFFSVTLGFFTSLMATSGLSQFTGLAQIIPVTPLIIWVMVMILSVVNIGAGGYRMAKKAKLIGNSTQS